MKEFIAKLKEWFKIWDSPGPFLEEVRGLKEINRRLKEIHPLELILEYKSGENRGKFSSYESNLREGIIHLKKKSHSLELDLKSPLMYIFYHHKEKKSFILLKGERESREKVRVLFYPTGSFYDKPLYQANSLKEKIYQL